MTACSRERGKGRHCARPSASASVLAEPDSGRAAAPRARLAAARHTALARRYNVTTAEIDAAIDLLARPAPAEGELPDGQVFRASPAEYRLSIEGMPGFATQVDPMGGELVCKTRNVARRRPPEDIARGPRGVWRGEDLLTIRCPWTVGGEPGAYSASYLPPQAGSAGREGLASAPAPPGAAVRCGRPCAFQVEFHPPAPSIARTLRLAAAEPAATVTVRFEDPAQRGVVVLAVAVLRPDVFPDRGGVARVLPKPAVGPDGFPGAWTGGGSGLGTLTRDAFLCDDCGGARPAARGLPHPGGHPRGW